MQKNGPPAKHETRIQTKVLPTTAKPSYKGVEVQVPYLSPQKAPTRTTPTHPLSTETSQQRETKRFHRGMQTRANLSLPR